MTRLHVAVLFLASALAGYGCSGLFSGPKHPALTMLECQVRVLAPYVGDAAAEIAREIDGNQAFDPALFLTRLGLTPAELLAVAQAYQACSPDPAPNAGTL